MGWIFENPETLKDVYSQRTSQDSLDQLLNRYDNQFSSTIAPLFFDTSIKLNLGGENDKARLEVTDKPQGIFDFSLASNSLYRVAEYFCQEIYDSNLPFFIGFDLARGVVPNSFVQTRQVGNAKEFFYEDLSDNKIYICEQRQKGLTEALKKDPTLPLQKQGTMTITTKFSPFVKFSSRTKKPYVKYKKRGGKVKYVEIYSLNYYSRMGGNFFMAVRHLPAIMVLDFLEKQGTNCKFYITRFVEQGADDYIREFDTTTNATLPLYECAENYWKKLVLIPKCVKDYGGAIDYSFIFGVGSDNQQMYDQIYYETMERELDPNNNFNTLGEPRWEQWQYEEGFERFRQKFLEYSKKGIWKAKEVKPQGLILYHDYYLNVNFKSEFEWLKSILSRENLIDYNRSNVNLDASTRTLMGNNNALKWFENYMKICAFIIKHRLDVYNTNNMSKTFREIEADIRNINDEIDLLIRSESNSEAKIFYEQFKENVNSRYLYNNVKAYCTQRVNEMTNYAEGGCFATPLEQQVERDEEASRLIQEILKC